MIAIESCGAHKISWVLDPVFVDRTPPRASFAQELLTRGPAVLRLNHAEFSALSAKRRRAMRRWPLPEPTRSSSRCQGRLILLPMANGLRRRERGMR